MCFSSIGEIIFTYLNGSRQREIMAITESRTKLIPVVYSCAHVANIKVAAKISGVLASLIRRETESSLCPVCKRQSSKAASKKH